MEKFNTITVAAEKTVTRKVGVQKGVHHRNKLEICLTYLKDFIEKVPSMKMDLTPIATEIEKAIQTYANRPKQQTKKGFTIEKLVNLPDEQFAKVMEMLNNAMALRKQKADDEAGIDEIMEECR